MSGATQLALLAPEPVPEAAPVAAAAPVDDAPWPRCWSCRHAYRADLLDRCACCGELVCGGCRLPLRAGDAISRHGRQRAAWLARRGTP